ncbi:MAG: pentapeptide repeat-containing protein, partial [Candidatus Eremiobacteraeota bacterium]|nr:pentapeptide repeat-containing protein [Candidatus Eremiobacteraeota bacterium]
GLFDSMILVPHSLLEGLSESEIDQICLHELAHLRRGDDWSNGMQRVLIALLAWNPAAQFIGQQLDLEREVACDDWVLSLGGSVRPYARCLTKMAERAAWPRYPVPAPGVFATRKHISLRIERLLGAGRNIATNLALAPAAAAVGTVGALALLITAVAPSVAAPAPTASPIPPAAIPPAVRQKAAEAKVKEIVRYVRIADTPRVIHVPALHVHVPARTIRVPAIDVERPAQTIPIAIPSVAYVDAARLRNEVKKSVGAALSEMKTARQNGRSCSGCDFGAVDWSGRDMRGVNYSGADLSHATLVGTNFAGSNLDGVDFNHANLRNASFRGAHMTGCDFGDADLTGVDFTGARLSGCQFTDARLDGAHLTGAVFADCDLEGVDMSRVDVSRAKFIGTDFSGKQSPP